jgi:hypothetical protein
LVREQFNPVGAAALSGDREHVEKASGCIELIRSYGSRGTTVFLGCSTNECIAGLVEQNGFRKRDPIGARREIAKRSNEVAVDVKFYDPHRRSAVETAKCGNKQIPRLSERHSRRQRLSSIQ